MEREIELRATVQLFLQLSHERQEEVLYFIGLALTYPGFWADFQSLTPAGKPSPPYETIQALAEKWAGQDIA